jgi:hypothetical protein
MPAIKIPKTTESRLAPILGRFTAAHDWAGYSAEVHLKRDQFPVPDLLYLVLRQIVGSSDLGPHDKTRWQVPFCCDDVNALLSNRRPRVRFPPGALKNSLHSAVSGYHHGQTRAGISLGISLAARQTVEAMGSEQCLWSGLKRDFDPLNAPSSLSSAHQSVAVPEQVELRPPLLRRAQCWAGSVLFGRIANASPSTARRQRDAFTIRI